MTEGPIWKRIVLFAIPLFWGHLFQQFYNTADTLIVGNFLGSNALAAVSSSGSLIMLLVGLFNGISIGASVIIGKYFGAGNMKAGHSHNDRIRSLLRSRSHPDRGNSRAADFAPHGHTR